MHADQERVLAIYGRIFDLEDLRKMVGLIPSTPKASPETSRRKVVLVGHDCESDFKKTNTDIGFSLRDNDAEIIGVADTKWLAEDTGCEEPGLSKLADRYRLAPMKESKPKFQDKKSEFEGAHNAGNDAIMTIKVLLATIFDRDISTLAYNGHEVLDEPLEACSRNLPNKHPFWQNAILVAIDLESREYDPRVVTELGIAWISLSEVTHLPPGDKGEGWHSAIYARHFMAKEWQGYRCKNFTVGNPWGFWKEYGRTEVVPKQGIAFRLGKQFRDFSQARIAIPVPASRDPKSTQPNTNAKNGSTNAETSESGKGGSESEWTESTGTNTGTTDSLSVQTSSCSVGKDVNANPQRERRHCRLCGNTHVDMGIASVEWDHQFWVRLSLSQAVAPPIGL
jgi:hypothetical protein